MADWPEARRAARYHVSRQIVGVDEAPGVSVATVHDTELIITGLPSGAKVVVSVAAANDAGESAPAVSAACTVP